MTKEEIFGKTAESLMKANEVQARQIAQLKAEIQKMSAQLDWFQQQMSGRKR